MLVHGESCLVASLVCRQGHPFDHPFFLVFYKTNIKKNQTGLSTYRPVSISALI